MRKLRGGNSIFSSTWFYLFLILIIVILISIVFLKKTKEGFSSGDTERPELIYYYMEGCGHCEGFNTTWNNLINDVKTVKFTKKNLRDNDAPKEINAAPTIILKINGKEIEYSGDRSNDDIKDFIETNIKSK